MHEVNDPVAAAAAGAANPRRLTVTVLGAFATNAATAVATGHSAPVPTVHIEHPPPPAAAATADAAHSLAGAVQMVSHLPVAFGAAPDAAAAASAAMDPTAEAQGVPANAAGSAPGPGHPAGGAGPQQGTLHVRDPSSTTGSTKSNINEHMDGREAECSKCTSHLRSVRPWLQVQGVGGVADRMGA